MELIALVLLTLFTVLNVLAPIASNKVVDVGITFAAGSLLVGVSYGLLDILNDWKGKLLARRTVETALIVRAAVFFIVLPVLFVLPAAKEAPGFSDFLTNSARLFAAGWASLFVGGWLVNTPLFSWLKAKASGKHFTLRYLTTSFPTIVAGSIVYGVLGFAGTPVDVPSLIIGTVIARILIGVAITPLVALGRAGVRRYYGTD